MAFSCRDHEVDVETDAAGAATEYTGYVTGRILDIYYEKDATNPFENTVDFTITTEDTAQNVWVESNVTASKRVLPRQGVHDTTGVAATIDGTRPLRDYIYVYRERIKIVVASGGDTNVGTFMVKIG